MRIGCELRYNNNGTFTLTTTYGASASLTFSGTAIWIYGAKRGNHGPYNTTLDGRVFTDDGFHDPPLFQQVLFSAVELDGTEPHNVSITNALTDTTRPYLDVDSVRTLWYTLIRTVGLEEAYLLWVTAGGRLFTRWRSQTTIKR